MMTENYMRFRATAVVGYVQEPTTELPAMRRVNAAGPSTVMFLQFD